MRFDFPPFPRYAVWLMFASRLPGSPDTARLLSESRELTLIFGKSVNTASQGRG